MTQHITVTLNPAEGQGEMIVRPSFYQLDIDDMKAAWDHHVGLAQRENLYTIGALLPEAGVEDAMHIEDDGTERWYLCTPAQLNGSARA